MTRVVSYLNILLVFLCVCELNAQNVGTLRGIVSDSLNGGALAFGNVYIEEAKMGASTDANGFFVITSVPADAYYTVTVSYVGYNTKQMEVYISKGKITHIDVELTPGDYELETIEKIGERYAEKNATDIGLQRITVRQLEMLPKGVEMDVFRSLQALPGVQSTGDVSARYYVRGSSSNQNLVLLEGMTIYNPFHAFGIFSAIDPETINSIEFYKGGFTAELGGRTSSIMKLVTKDGNKNRLAASGSVSQLTGKVMIEGPIPHGSFFVSARKSHSREVLKNFLNDETAPIDFYDGSFKLTYSNPDFLPISKFTINGFISNDKVNNNDPEQEDFEWSNELFGLKWFQAADSPLYYEVSLTYSHFYGEVFPKLSNARQRYNELTDLSFGLDFSVLMDNKDEVLFGMDIKDVKTDLTIENNFGVTSTLAENGAAISIFSKYKFLRYENLGIDVGTRLNFIRMSTGGQTDNIFEPRASITYALTEWLTLKGAWGIYQQELTTLSDETEIISLFEPWVIIPEYLKPARSVHYTGGAELQLASNTSLEIEGYYKITNDAPVVNNNKVYDDDNDLVTGKEESYGWEFLFKSRPYPFNITASYTLSWAYKEVDGWVYYPRYDTRHSVDLALECDLGAGWSASATWTYNSGLPFTQSIGYYDKFYYTDLIDDWYIYNSYQPYALLRDINLGRMPDYHKLDLNLSKQFDFNFVKITVDGSIINVYDRENLFYYDRNTGKRVNMLPFLPTASVKVEL